MDSVGQMCQTGTRQHQTNVSHGNRNMGGWTLDEQTPRRKERTERWTSKRRGVRSGPNPRLANAAESNEDWQMSDGRMPDRE